MMISVFYHGIIIMMIAAVPYSIPELKAVVPMVLAE
jgi:hypothetical protein